MVAAELWWNSKNEKEVCKLPASTFAQTDSKSLPKRYQYKTLLYMLTSPKSFWASHCLVHLQVEWKSSALIL